jgi:hypothetical protein
MLNFFKRVYQDVLEGQNLEVYLTLLVALVLLILDIFGLVSPNIVAAGTLATLALLAYSTLNNRQQMHQVAEISTTTQTMVEMAVKGEQNADDFFWKEKRFLSQDLARARFIGLAGITLSRTVREYQDVFESRLAAGAELRFVVIDAASTAPQQAVLRSKGGVGASFYADLLRPTVARICLLADLAQASGKVELGLLPYAPSFGLFVIDPDKPHGRIIVEIYQHKSLALNPTFELSAQRDDRWYKFFREQFDLLWESCGERRGAGDQIYQFREGN